MKAARPKTSAKVAASLLRTNERVTVVVSAIPEGRVATYGAIARHLNLGPRQVAFVLANLSEEDAQKLPWFRVVAANGIISSIKRPSVGQRQIRRLRAEGVIITPDNRVQEFASITWTPGF